MSYAMIKDVHAGQIERDSTELKRSSAHVLDTCRGRGRASKDGNVAVEYWGSWCSDAVGMLVLRGDARARGHLELVAPCDV